MSHIGPATADPTPAPARSAGTPTERNADFNGDGFGDIAVGVPRESVGAVSEGGGVNVLYGSPSGLAGAGNQFWSQDSQGILEAAEGGDEFGHGLASADFDGDGFDDLAVGVPFEDVGAISNAGAVNVLFGSAGGLSARDQLFSQNSPGILDDSEDGDLFGASLAAGDVNGDGRADLAVGVRMEDVGGAISAGAVNLLFGSPTGLTATGNQFWSQDSPGVEGDGAESGDVFSRGLGLGDFDGDGFADLAVGAWEEDLGSIENAGAVNVLYGGAGGLTSDGDQSWTQDSPGVLDQSEPAEWFGKPVISGDFDADGFADLVVGVHLESVGTARSAGGANVLYGSAAGLTADGNQFWTQDSPQVEDLAEKDDHFGRAAVAADLNGDGFDDLAVGVSEEDVGVLDAAGAANVLYGSPGGLSADGDQLWTQDTQGVKETAEANDLFGWYVACSDFDGDGFDDLAAAAAYEDLGAAADAGGMHVLYGTAAGLSAQANQFWTQDNAGVKEVAEGEELFGAVMA